MASDTGTTGSVGLVEDNLALVPYFMNRMNMVGEWDDLEQAGRIGLMRAAELYDPKLGKFSNYAANWIKNAIRRESDKLNHPGSTFQNFLDNRLREVTEAELQARLLRRPTRDEMVEVVGEQVADIRLEKPLSINADPYETDGDYDGKWLTHEDDLSLFDELEQLDYLEPDEKSLLVAHGMGYTHIEIAEAVGVLPETIGIRLRKLKARLMEEI